MTDRIEFQQLTDALVADEWTPRRSAFTAEVTGYWYPGEEDEGRWLPVHPRLVGPALAELARAAATGQRASRVLASLAPKPAYSGSSGLDRLTGDWTLECTEHGVIYRSADNTGNTAAWSAHCSTAHGKDSDRG